ncbi:MAG: cyclodeaminase/cyclohydrolase family protein [Candidatus Thermoplasmatota archaeon]|nr:cyclodeaminase/cyclohydrolase family protein [Candidatus Thermoplasmatota archaeon]
MLAEKSIEELLNELASSAPAPGGGSAAALSGALGSALLAMVCRVTIGKKGYEGVAVGLENILKDLENARKKLTGLITEDAIAFDRVAHTYKEGGSKESIESALKHATLIPLEVMRLSFATLKLAKEVAEKGNPSAISDTGCACLCLESALKCAELNIKINLSSIADRNFIAETKKEVEKLISDSEALKEEIMTIVGKRMLTIKQVFIL